MATQTTASKPLNPESENEKRRREAAQNYLNSRSALDKARTKGVDMTDVDYGKMSEEQFRAEGNRRLSSIESDFKTAALAANKEGINSSKAAQEYLNRGQARIVGDTLVGSAAGISAREWDKRDRSAAAGVSSPIPQKDLVQVGPGVRMDQASLDRTVASIDASNKQKEDARPNYELAKQAVARIGKERDALSAEKAQASIERHNRFLRGGSPLTQFQQDIKDKREAEVLGREMQATAERELRDARLANRAAKASARQAEREGRPIDPRLLEIASRTLSERLKGVGGTNNASQRRDLFQAQALKQIQGSRSPGTIADTPSTPNESTNSVPSNLGHLSRTNPFESQELKAQSSLGTPISMTLDGPSPRETSAMRVLESAAPRGGAVMGGMSEGQGDTAMGGMSEGQADTAMGGMSEGQADTAMGGQVEERPSANRRRFKSRLVRGVNLYS